jgi:hypothetical protein
VQDNLLYQSMGKINLSLYLSLSLLHTHTSSSTRSTPHMADPQSHAAVAPTQDAYSFPYATSTPTPNPVDPTPTNNAAGPTRPVVPASNVHAPIVESEAAGGYQPAIQAAKDGAKQDNVQGTGVSTSSIANELGLGVRNRDEHEAIKEREDIPTRPQDLSTGGLVKQHDVAEDDALDAHTHNVWAHPDEVPKEVIEGLDNDELWKILRRFDKQMYHVKAIPGQKRGPHPEEEMDLVNASDEEFSPDRLRSNMERLYINFIVGSAAFVKHIARLRAWTEFNRTASWCAVSRVACLYGKKALADASSP